MFTGIIQEVGEIRSAEETQTGLSIEVSVKESFTANLLDGASVSVNGVCLTAVGSNNNIT